MNRKAFTLMELLLVVVIMVIFATSSIPFLFDSFYGFNEITEQETVINVLNETSVVMTRRAVFDGDSISKILSSLSATDINKTTDSGTGTTITCNLPASASGVTVKCTAKNASEVDNTVAVTLEGTKGKSLHKLNYLIYPAQL